MELCKRSYRITCLLILVLFLLSIRYYQQKLWESALDVAHQHLTALPIKKGLIFKTTQASSPCQAQKTNFDSTPSVKNI
ncbi:hypothetical protein C900_01172 [Fulvivirga imtechensis AK7]|uniref:Uncharacterized protein n=1 Tax=Fulvivirga imtechensis AK7 TaxID=1237149 RepID=L8JIK3_9BACT|nr:hypothetical protein C900_01172 [Fulvivirga imtechensis AK7]